MSALRTTALAGLTVVASLLPASGAAHHVTNNTEDPIYLPSRDSMKTRSQLEAGVRFVERALAALYAFDASRDPQLLHTAEHNCVEGYYFLRAGLASLTFQKDNPKSRTGFVDPLVPLARGKVENANHLARNARTHINYLHAGDLSHFGGAVEKLQTAIAEVETALQLII